MNTATIDELAYLIRQAKEENLPKPIVFLGAGASRTGGVPLAAEIVSDILSKYKGNPTVRRLKGKENDYPTLMACLTPFERNNLLKGYIQKAKINVTHIYLAQLLVNGYIDYILTVNFDNLMLRALALYNEFPPTYDMAILKDLTTTSPKEKSVVYLHGQHHGLWLLNTDEEMNKVRETIPPIINSIKNQRCWIFIGYSGEDPVFEHITKLGRFDNGLYWVAYNDNKPCDAVCTHLLERENTNAFLITGYDSDSFLLKLNQELGMAQPPIMETPFTALRQTLENIVDVDDKEYFKGVKERLEIVKNQVSNAIMQFEEAKEMEEYGKMDRDIDQLKKRIIDVILNGRFDEPDALALYQEAIAQKRPELNVMISDWMFNWANSIYKLAKSKHDPKLYEQSIEKYQQATEFNPSSAPAFNNWGLALSDLAKLKENQELYVQSFDKYQRATELNPASSLAFNNWGNAIYGLAKIRGDSGLFEDSFKKFEKATELDPTFALAFNNWGTAIWGSAKVSGDHRLYEQSFEKYRKATELDSAFPSAFYNWGTAIWELAELANDKKYYDQAMKILQQAVDLGAAPYNLACLYAVQNDKLNALLHLEKCLNSKYVKVTFVKSDNDWKDFLDDSDFMTLLDKYPD